MAEKGFWPLYEGKQIDQFVVDAKPVERWLSLEAAEKKYQRLPSAAPKLVFHDIARNTDIRTCIAAVLPERSCSGHTLTTLEVIAIESEVAAAVLNSFAFDFLVRLRTAGTHLSASFLARVAVPAAGDCASIPAIATVSASQRGNWEQDPAWFEQVWMVNRAVAEAYGLSAEDLSHILDSFPVFPRKRPEFHAYLKAKLAAMSDW